VCSNNGDVVMNRADQMSDRWRTCDDRRVKDKLSLDYREEYRL